MFCFIHNCWRWETSPDVEVTHTSCRRKEASPTANRYPKSKTTCLYHGGGRPLLRRGDKCCDKIYPVCICPLSGYLCLCENLQMAIVSIQPAYLGRHGWHWAIAVGVCAQGIHTRFAFQWPSHQNPIVAGQYFWYCHFGIGRCAHSHGLV